MATFRKDRRVVICYEDEMTSQLTPTLTRMWSLRKHQPEPGMWVGTTQKTHIFGALNATTGKFVSMQANWINAVSFIRFLRRIKSVYNNKRVIMILDNARWHKAKKLKRILKKFGIRFVFLPPYCPMMNPVEKVWKLYRCMVTHNYFHRHLDRLIKATADFFRSTKAFQSILRSYCKIC